MNKMIRKLLLLTGLTLGSSSLLAQPAVKLIVVDMAKVFDGHYKSEEANAKFRDLEQKAQEQGEEIRKQGQAMMEEYRELVDQSKNALLTAEARTKAEADAQKKAGEIQQKQTDLQNFIQGTRNQLQQRIKNHRELLLEEISKVVADMAKRQGATLVIDKSGPTLFGIPSVIYSDPAYDITEEVLKEVNKDRPAPAAPAATPAAPATQTPPPAAPPAVEPKK